MTHPRRSTDPAVVVFDVDGVLIEPRFPRVLRERLGVTTADAAEFFGGAFRHCLQGTADLHAELGPHLARWRWPHSTEAFIELWLQTDADVHAPALAFAERLQAAGYRCVVASNQERRRATHLCALLPGFERRFFSCDLGMCKPDPAFFTAVQRALDVAPHALLLLDDQMQNVNAAHAAGWHARECRIGEDFAALARTCSLAV